MYLNEHLIDYWMEGYGDGLRGQPRQSGNPSYLDGYDTGRRWFVSEDAREGGCVMPTYTVLLAHDVTYYGNVSVEGDTWEEAVASLTLDDWDECYEAGDGAGNSAWSMSRPRTAYIEAEDIHYNCALIHCQSVIQRLREIQIAADPDAALALFIDELRTMGQDPIFKKESN
jgi:hypothetical protein